MSNVKQILTITINDEVKEFTSVKEISDYYPESTKFIIIVEAKSYTREPLDQEGKQYVHDYLYKTSIRNSKNEETIIKYENFILKINDYFESITYASNIPRKGFRFEIIDKKGYSYNNQKIMSLIKGKSFEKDFSKNDTLFYNLQTIIKFMDFIKSFEDLKDVEEIISSYK